LRDFFRIAINNSLYYLNESSISSLLADFCILEVRIRYQNRIRLSSNSTIRRRLKETIDLEKTLLKWFPIIRSKNWNR
jgi:hypothetical protein